MDGVPGVDFGPEKTAFRDIVSWAERLGMRVVPRAELKPDVRDTTDLVLAQGRRRLYVRARPKLRSDDGTIDLDARPRMRHVRLRFRPQANGWEAVNDSEFVEDLAWSEEGFAVLVRKLLTGR